MTMLRPVRPRRAALAVLLGMALLCAGCQPDSRSSEESYNTMRLLPSPSASLPAATPEETATPAPEGTDTPYINEEDGNSENPFVGMWYDRDGRMGTLSFDNGGNVEYYSVADDATFYGTYEYDYDVGDGTIFIDIDGEQKTWWILENIISGTAYLEVYTDFDGEAAVFTRDYTEQNA